MTSITLSAPSSLQAGRLGRWLASALVLAVCGGFMFFDLRTPPIVLWDESRMAVNALEMHLSGHLSLVTTYGFQPDLWNTKPPLLVWLMDLSMSAFGPSEWALRLPSITAALGVLALVMSFTRRVTGSVAAGAVAALVLALSISFFGEHGARTADYEPLLSFFTTAYLYVLFFALHRERPGLWRPALVGLLITGAVMTKGIAGLLPGVGVPAYLLIVGRWRRPLLTPGYVLAGLGALAIAATYLILREHAAPGYLHAMMFNDVSGRFGVALDRHSGPPWYYLEAFTTYAAFSTGTFTVAAPLALATARRTSRLGLIYCLCIVAGALGVLSTSATKLIHYAATSLPFMAIMVAIALSEGIRLLDRASAAGRTRILTPRKIRLLLAIVLALIAVGSVQARMVFFPNREFYPQAMYGELFREMSARGVSEMQVLESGVVKPGVAADGVPKDYAPQFDFYRLRAGSEGLKVTRVAPTAIAIAQSGTVVATCDPVFASRLRGLGANLSQTAGCVAVRR